MDIKEERSFSGEIGNHWYYRSKSLALNYLVKTISYSRILDVGAGSGVFSKFLLKGQAQSAICVDPGYAIEERQEFVAGKPIRFIRRLDSSDSDLILLMDVIEHVADDVGLIREALSASANPAYVVITVPAFQFLFSAHDRYLEHHRRYSLKQLEGVVRQAGLEIVSCHYFFLALFPLATVLRLTKRESQPKSDLRQHSWLMNQLLTLVHRIELPTMRFNRLAGLSIFCLAKRP